MARVQEEKTKDRRWARDKAVRAKLDNITPMTLWRWRKNTSLGFPQPVKVNKTNFTDLDEIDSWLVKRATR
jgi:hypothetical protein